MALTQKAEIEIVRIVALNKSTVRFNCTRLLFSYVLGNESPFVSEDFKYRLYLSDALTFWAKGVLRFGHNKQILAKLTGLYKCVHLVVRYRYQ